MSRLVEQFAAYQRDGYSLREPATNTAGLLRLTAVGDCVAPLLTQGDTVYIDGNSPPQHGDLAYFRWADEVVDRWNASDRKQEWVQRFGDTDFSNGIKLYVETNDGKPWLVNTDNYRPAEGHTILGRVVAVERKGKRLIGNICDPTVPVAGLDQNAATTVVNLAQTAPVNVAQPTLTPPFNYKLVASIQVPAYPYANTLVVTVTGVGTMQVNALNTALTVTLTNNSNTPDPGTIASPVIAVTQNNSAIDSAAHSNSFATEQYFSVPANTPTGFYLWGLCYIGGAGSGSTATVSSVNLKAEVLKR